MRHPICGLKPIKKSYPARYLERGAAHEIHKILADPHRLPSAAVRRGRRLPVVWPGGGAQTALVYQDGVCIRTIDLSRVDAPCSFTVEWENGYNIIEVERGRIRVSEADCPDKVCVRRGWVSDSAAPIACLPHKLVIQLEGGGEADIDGVAG